MSFLFMFRIYHKEDTHYMYYLVNREECSILRQFICDLNQHFNISCLFVTLRVVIFDREKVDEKINKSDWYLAI